MREGSAEKLVQVLALAGGAVTNAGNFRRAALYFALAVSGPAWPQASSSGGAVEGWIFDASTASVVSAHVEARNQETGLTRLAESDGRGYYRINDLPVGVYTI